MNDANMIAVEYCKLVRDAFTSADVQRLCAGEDPLNEAVMPGELLEEAIANVLGADLDPEEYGEDKLDALRDAALEDAQDAEYMLGLPEADAPLAAWIEATTGGDSDLWMACLLKNSQLPDHSLLTIPANSGVGVPSMALVLSVTDTLKHLFDLRHFPSVDVRRALIKAAAVQIRIFYFG